VFTVFGSRRNSCSLPDFAFYRFEFSMIAIPMSPYQLNFSIDTLFVEHVAQ